MTFSGPAACGPGLDRHMRAYDHAVPADWPETLPTWQRYYQSEKKTES